MASESEVMLVDNSVEDDEFTFTLKDELESDVKKKKRGILYLSTIPRGMNVTKAREIFSNHGIVGRIFLQPAKPKNPAAKKKPAKFFTEGWIEFESKRVAKETAKTLNNTVIGGRKKSKFYDQTWNMKYLPRFKWVHLSERLAYEQAVRRQRMRVEIFQAKKEADYFSHNLDVSDKLKKLRKKTKDISDQDGSKSQLALPRQRQNQAAKSFDATSSNVSETKQKKRKKKGDTRTEFLTNLFG